MALYIDSAFLDDIMNAAKSTPVAGITTNPSLMLAAYERGQRLDPLSLLKVLLEGLGGTIFIQPGASEEQEMYEQAIAYIESEPQRVIPKIPMSQSGMRVALRLKLLGHRVAFTAVTSVAQAYAAAMAQADYIIPYYNRLERSGIDASVRVAEMAELLHNQHVKTRILVASIKSTAEASAALQAGAHDLTIAPEVALEMVRDPLSEQAIDTFAQDWQKMNRL